MNYPNTPSYPPMEGSGFSNQTGAPNTSSALPQVTPEMDRDMEEFRQLFPQVFLQAAKDPKTIPPEVWDMVQQGKTLTDAYCRYVAMQTVQNGGMNTNQNDQSSRRSTGSMRSAGSNATLTDPFLRGFLGED